MTRLMLIWFPRRFSEIHQAALRPTICFDDYLHARVRPPLSLFKTQVVLPHLLEICHFFFLFLFLTFWKRHSNIFQIWKFLETLFNHESFRGTNLKERNLNSHIKNMNNESGSTLKSSIHNANMSTTNLVAVLKDKVNLSLLSGLMNHSRACGYWKFTVATKDIKGRQTSTVVATAHSYLTQLTFAKPFSRMLILMFSGPPAMDVTSKVKGP